MDKKNHESLRLCSFNKISIVSFFNKFEKKNSSIDCKWALFKFRQECIDA